jgi:serine/threonine-protein kinase
LVYDPVGHVSSLEIKVDEESGVACVRLSGVIDEKFNSDAILDKMQPLTILEVSGVKRITSFGVRQWTEAMKGLPVTVKHLYLVRCPPVFVDQLSMVLNFAGRAEVISAYAICVCEKCGDEAEVLLDFVGDRTRISAGQMPESKCNKCNRPMPLGDDPHTFVRLINEFGAKNVEVGAASLMERLGLHSVRRVGKPPEATKLVHEQITLFRLSGTLDGRFRQKRLASGVEGDVVFDLAEIEGLDAVGAERWRELLSELSAAISITVVDVPEMLLGPIADGVFSMKGVGLYSYQTTFQCADCGNIELRSIKADEPLAACIRPCPRCGRDASPATDVGLIEQVITRARPAAVKPAVEAMIRDRKEILQRAKAQSGAVSSAASGDSLARYRVIKPLSEGGMAEIFLAVHQGIAGFEKLVVLKKILRKMLERRQVAVQLFLNEAKIAANLNHPNIVQTFEVGEHGGDLFIAMEYIHGVDLRRLLRQSILKQETTPTEQMLYVAERVAAALHHAHTAKDLSGKPLNIVHRDVSPSNVILGFDGQVKLLDFGVASASVGESFEGVIGKFSYMSPEQLAREPLDGRSDVFALGVVLYELLARRPLFRRDSDHETIRAVLHSDIPKLAPKVPDYVDAVIAQALARKREERFPDARALQVALEDCIRRLGNMPTHEQIASTLAKLYPAESAAPAFDPSLYRATNSMVGTASRTPSDRTPSSERTPPSLSKDHELTLVNADSSGALEDATSGTAGELAAAAKKDKKPRRSGTFPFDSTKSETPMSRSEPPKANGSRPKTPTPVPPTPLPPTTIPPAPASRPPMTKQGTGPLIPPGPVALQELPPITPPPNTRPPSLTGLPGQALPPQLHPSTPLPAELQVAAMPEKKSRATSDYWLIAAAVLIFIIGFLLVVL